MRFAIRALLSVAALSACNFLSDPTTEGCGTFAGRASGAATDSLIGCAAFANFTLTGEFGMLLTNGAPTTAPIKVKLLRALTPDTGVTYTIGAEPNPFSGVILIGARTFTISSGTIRMNSKAVSQGTKISGFSGTLNVTGVEAGGAQVGVTGRFEALCMAIDEFGETDQGVEGKGVCGGGPLALKSPGY